jgi:hypothetical protein
MVTREQAEQVVATYLDEHVIASFDFDSPLPLHEDRHVQKLVVVKVEEHDFGWLFYYDGSVHAQSGSPGDAVVGNAPLIVDRADGKLYVTGTALPIEHYLREYRLGIRTRA